jgi:CheY-like chemotaxis protein
MDRSFYKILIVEDNLESSDLLLRWLRMEGYEIVCARDGQEGFDLALAVKPDLILTDLSMPNLDGVKMIRMLRKAPQLASVPVVVLTAGYSGLVSQATDSGATMVIYKPVIIEQLFRVIKEQLSLIRI